MDLFSGGLRHSFHAGDDDDETDPDHHHLPANPFSALLMVPGALSGIPDISVTTEDETTAVNEKAERLFT